MAALTGHASSPPIKRRADNVYHILKRSILLRQRRDGDALREQDLALDMNCSQGTVREALMRLQHEGLVTRRGYRGTVVSNTSADEASLLADIRIRIEMIAAARATVSLHLVAEELRAIVVAMQQCDAARDTYALTVLDHRFHGAVLRAAKLEAAEPILTQCMLHIHRHTVGNPVRQGGNSHENAADAHETLLGELATGDAARAATAAREHVETVIRRWSPDVWAMMSP